MFVAVARITLSIPDSGSLKSKRHVVHKVLDKVKSRFNVSIAEVEDNDLWQKATIGVAAVANDHAFAQESVDKVLRFVEELYVAPVLCTSTEVIPMGGELYGDDGSSFGAMARGAHRSLAEAEAEAERSETWRSMRTLAEAEGEVSRSRPQPRVQPAGKARKPLGESERERALDELRQRMRALRPGENEGDED
ncbi:MAG TPA: DUF503 domain-containing protein [Myxococcales bacterium]|jgi:hypothetical protein|nr:DUF503 domain-containing protein [Myxococcales bacterium]